jgi:mannose-6-phosphate isomerase
VVVTLLLNRVTLRPGEAIHLTAGNLHAYLSGAGIELMGASDNVVRGGLTEKHVDVDELLRILDITPLAEPVMTAAARSGRYALPEAGCTLVRIEPGRTHTSTGHELTVGLDGRTLYLPPGAHLTPTAPTFVVTTP